MKNIFVHDYPGEEEIKKEELKKSLVIVQELFAVLERVKVTMEKNSER